MSDRDDAESLEQHLQWHTRQCDILQKLLHGRETGSSSEDEEPTKDSNERPAAVSWPLPAMIRRKRPRVKQEPETESLNNETRSKAVAVLWAWYVLQYPPQAEKNGTGADAQSVQSRERRQLCEGLFYLCEEQHKRSFLQNAFHYHICRRHGLQSIDGPLAALYRCSPSQLEFHLRASNLSSTLMELFQDEQQEWVVRYACCDLLSRSDGSQFNELPPRQLAMFWNKCKFLFRSAYLDQKVNDDGHMYQMWFWERLCELLLNLLQLPCVREMPVQFRTPNHIQDLENLEFMCELIRRKLAKKMSFRLDERSISVQQVCWVLLFARRLEWKSAINLFNSEKLKAEIDENKYNPEEILSCGIEGPAQLHVTHRTTRFKFMAWQLCYEALLQLSTRYPRRNPEQDKELHSSLEHVMQEWARVYDTPQQETETLISDERTYNALIAAQVRAQCYCSFFELICKEMTQGHTLHTLLNRRSMAHAFLEGYAAPTPARGNDVLLLMSILRFPFHDYEKVMSGYGRLVHSSKSSKAMMSHLVTRIVDCDAFSRAWSTRPTEDAQSRAKQPLATQLRNAFVLFSGSNLLAELLVKELLGSS